ncbi:hypothetical protein QL285_039727 [Trifolium repens]|nr:hypothetical protein QL285_039727 [Trifolium repens]
MGNCFSNNPPASGGSSKHFPCHVCTSSFRSQNALDNHLKTHSGKFQCFKCTRAFETKADREAHMEAAECSKA